MFLKHFSRLSVVVFFVLVGFSSCVVSKKKFDAETARADKEHAEKVALIARLNQEIDKNNKLTAQLRDLNKKISDLSGQNTELNDKNNQLRDSITTMSDNISELNNKVSMLGNEKASTAKQLNSSNAEIAEQRRKLEQLQAMIDQQKKATEDLRKKISDALQGFNSNELTVTMKNGKVYISMQEGLLFPSGSAEVNPKGKVALSKVASVLNTNSDINIDIEGHTDSIPIHNKVFPDNWALSTARSTSIAHVLIDEYKVNPTKLIASGRSEYDPVAPNSSPEGRGKNRRTEIILEPKLDELMSLLNGKAK